MAEAMTSETIAEAEWLLRGYWTKLRFPFKTDSGGWGDVDILAYHPEKKHLVVSESKVRGPKTHIYAYTKATAGQYGDIFEYDGDNYLSFLVNIPTLCRDRVIFQNFSRMVKRLTLQLVSNYAISREVVHQVESDIRKRTSNEMSVPVLLAVQIDTTIDVIARIIELERKSIQGRRYGHPVIDIAREINRYISPTVRYAGRGREATEAVRLEGITNLLRALKIEGA